ncbi:hypothetical protein [Polymorphospora lycopeni]|uniref:Uncharacterized protein n=1 Tax=Polymorphospora lycopeni TaxID=3140240 RepID=A0ABV5CK39_9ACTN
MGLPTLVLAVWLAATAVPVLRGSNVGRILVFVAGGAQLAVCGLQGCSGLLFLPLLVAIDDVGYVEEGAVDGPDGLWEESEFLATLYAEPIPFGDLSFLATGVGTVLVLTLTGAVVLLLALPPAHRYFVPRPARQPAPPPVPAWPVHPGGYAVPMPYLVCPDPSAHFPPTTDKPASAPPPGGTNAPSSTSDPGGSATGS